MKLKYFLLGALLLPTFSYAQSPAKLVGITHSVYADSAFMSVDSAWLGYSNGRGSDVKTTPEFYPSLDITPTGNAGTFNYDTWYSGVYDTTHALMTTGLHTHMFDSASGKLMSNTFSIPDSAMMWMDQSRVNYQYDSATGNIASQTSQDMVGTTWVNDMMYSYTYDPANNVTSITSTIWNGTSWDNNTKYVYYYNFLNKVTSSLIQTWNGSSWQNSEHYIYYSHDNNMTVDSVFYQVMVGPNWTTITKDVFANDANGDAIANWHYNGGVPEYADSTIYNAMHSRTAQTHKLWDSTAAMFMNQKHYDWAYNAYNQPTTMQSSTWDSSGFWIFNNSDMLTTYYYMLDTATKVAGVSNNAGNLNLYPVPAQNLLNIDMTWNKAQAFSVTVFDVQGRMLRHWNEAATTSYSKTIPVTDLAAGNYFLVIKGTDGNTVRQFSIAH